MARLVFNLFSIEPTPVEDFGVILGSENNLVVDTLGRS